MTASIHDIVGDTFHFVARQMEQTMLETDDCEDKGAIYHRTGLAFTLNLVLDLSMACLAVHWPSAQAIVHAIQPRSSTCTGLVVGFRR
jgi:hypothetical protein